jgi:hypothetical protein
MKYAILIVLALSCTACLALLALATENVKSVVDLADTACVLLDKKTNDKTVEQVCATQEELTPLVDSILASRKMGAGKVGAAAPTKTECPVCPACKPAAEPPTEAKPTAADVKPKAPEPAVK